ncbi:MAG: hypothetical protein H7Y30_02480 [Pyrinomonadaceae bacterium]|nr:hypothetical protein [Pyrinomonadaceae bacterium]
MAEHKCSECGGEMEEGFILDRSYGTRLVSSWVKGSPEPSFWLGLSVKGKEFRTVQTWRCVQCGFLKSYAVTEVDPPSNWEY